METLNKLPPQNHNKISSFDEYVGWRVRMARISAGESQQALGARLHITFQQIQKYEKGVNKISFDKVYEIGQFYGLPLGYFIEGYSPEGVVLEEQEFPTLMRERLSMRIISVFNKLDPKLQKTFSDLLTSIAATRGTGNG
jgi:transcriptional regulator with XRE-family HTH domain